MNFFDKYTGFFRRVKAFYIIHNLLNYRHLKANKALYKKHNIQRPVWRSISSKHFPNSEQSIETDHNFWNENGYLKLDQFFSSDFIDQINMEVERALENGLVDFNYTQKKILFAYEKIPTLKKVINNSELKIKLERLAGEEIVPFQSINFLMGSEQRAHSDSVHMATYPLGGLIAIWVALEDVDEENGTLFYYPGSHKMPYATNQKIGNASGWLLSPNPNKNYEDYLEQELEKAQYKKEIFTAKKGDVLIWHANLVHGGLPHLNKNRSRKSMVVHYFVKNRICYHELSQRPAIVKEIE
jgi:hypothetical protein